MIVPWVASGNSVRFGYDILEYVSVMDTAAATLWSLGIELPSSWVSKPLMSIWQ